MSKFKSNQIQHTTKEGKKVELRRFINDEDPTFKSVTLQTKGGIKESAILAGELSLHHPHAVDINTPQIRVNEWSAGNHGGQSVIVSELGAIKPVKMTNNVAVGSSTTVETTSYPINTETVICKYVSTTAHTLCHVDFDGQFEIPTERHTTVLLYHYHKSSDLESVIDSYERTDSNGPGVVTLCANTPMEVGDEIRVKFWQNKNTSDTDVTWSVVDIEVVEVTDYIPTDFNNLIGAPANNPALVAWGKTLGKNRLADVSISADYTIPDQTNDFELQITATQACNITLPDPTSGAKEMDLIIVTSGDFAVTIVGFDKYVNSLSDIDTLSFKVLNNKWSLRNIEYGTA